NSDQVKFDRESPYRHRQRLLSTLKWRQLYGRGILLSQRGTQHDHQRRDPAGQYETDGNPDVFVHRVDNLAAVYIIVGANQLRAYILGFGVFLCLRPLQSRSLGDSIREISVTLNSHYLRL